MKNKYAMVTRCNEKAARLAGITHPILKCYSKMWDADFIVLEGEYCKSEDYQLNHYMILQVGELLDKYDRILVIDSDVVVMPGCPDPFKTVGVDKIGSIYEDKGSRQQHRRQIIRDIQAKFGDVGWTEGYINSGFLVVSKQHKKIFEKINGELWTQFGFDDPLLAYNIHKYGFEIQELPCEWNFMSMFSEPWNNNANRFNAYVIHYSGQANFPDDQSENRVAGSNELKDRTLLIQSDIDRITTGLMTFEETKPVGKQGGGSYTYESVIGVQRKPVILKVHSTMDGMKREIEAYGKELPYTADYYGLCEDPNIGKFIMLEKLVPLPEKLDATIMKELATKSLILLRECYKKGVPWICRLEHMMMVKDGAVKFIDFNDEPVPDCPFYGYEGREAIIMDGLTDESGIYLDRGKYPRSGWWAIMAYLIQKNKLNIDILYEAEYKMVEREYQALKDVHQPVFFEEYKDILRTETEQDDPNFGKLVKPNRSCDDRAEMIITNFEEGEGETWLDIGCNVGWFCFQFDNLSYAMSGVDKDPEKIEFCRMMVQDQKTDIQFINMEIDIETIEKMDNYDIISVFSTLHLKLVEDKDPLAFWELFKSICEKANYVVYFEFPNHALQYLNITGYDSFIDNVKLHGNFETVKQIGISDAGRPVLKCRKP